MTLAVETRHVYGSTEPATAADRCGNCLAPATVSATWHIEQQGVSYTVGQHLCGRCLPIVDARHRHAPGAVAPRVEDYDRVGLEQRKRDEYEREQERMWRERGDA